MKFLVILILSFAVLTADAGSIGINGDMPDVIKDTMEQSFTCAFNMGQRGSKIPRVGGIGLEPFPEDNESLNELWGCIFQKKGLIEANKINAEKLRAYLMAMFTIFVEANDDIRQMADEITDTCEHVEASNSGLMAVKLQNCINYHVKEKAGM